MKKIQELIEKSLVPVANKITSNYWFSIVADAVLYIVPFSMVSAIPSLWSIFITVFPNLNLPSLQPIAQYSFGLIGLFVSFIIPYNTLVKEKRQDRSLIGGFTGIGVFMLSMNIISTESGHVVDIGKFGAGGMFTAIFVGLLVAIIFKSMVKFSFFGEDSPLPDFVMNWFDNIFAIFLSLMIPFIVSTVFKVDIFKLVTLFMKPVTGFAQTMPGFIMIVTLQNLFYFFGISGWVFTPVTRTITQAAIAQNAALVAAGQSAKNIYSYGIARYYHIGGQGATLPVAIMMIFSKSRRYKLLGKATIIPSIFNINEPLVYGSIVNNPFMFIPMILLSVILPAVTYLWLNFGLGTIHFVNFDMNFMPNPISAFVMSGGDWRNALLVVINFFIAAVVWYPFFKVADKHMYDKEKSEVVESTL